MLPPTIPLFPLPNVVLFPGVFLPLHIFEERYRAMVRDVLADGSAYAGRFVVSMITEGSEVGDDPRKQKLQQVIRAAGLGAAAAHLEAAKGVAAHDRAGARAVDVNIAGFELGLGVRVLLGEPGVEGDEVGLFHSPSTSPIR